MARLIPIDAPVLQAAIWRPLIKCGQQSLEVFCVGIYLAFIAYFILETTSGGIFAELLVGAAGVSIMTAVAYYRYWSKRVEKPVHADLHRSTGEESRPPISDLVVPQANRAVVSAM